MRNLTTAVVAISACGGAAMAGGIDRSGQGIGYLFEKGTYAELSFGAVAPNVTASGNPYGNVTNRYTAGAMGLKWDLNEKVSMAIGIDSPYGADTDYGVSLGIPFSAKLETKAITALGRYKMSPNLSLHGGLYNASMEGTYTQVVTTTVNRATDTGFILGGAYEREDIAARVAVTYFSGTDHVDASSNSSVNAPQAVNIDFQTGIAANTLLFGGLRWADWSETVINVAGNDIVTYDNDSVTYSLGIGRKFTDSFSGALTLGYEETQGGTASALAPTDGYLSLGLGGTYTRGNMKITAGLRSIKLGDATTSGLPANNWVDNSALAGGIKVAFSF